MPTDQKTNTQPASASPSAAAPADTLTDPLASWVLPNPPSGYGGPDVISPYSNINPLNPMAAQMQQADPEATPSDTSAAAAMTIGASKPVTEFAE